MQDFPEGFTWGQFYDIDMIISTFLAISLWKFIIAALQRGSSNGFVLQPVTALSIILKKNYV
jgi:hypothetical protein